jgi:hypothetical protein
VQIGEGAGPSLGRDRSLSDIALCLHVFLASVGDVGSSRSVVREADDALQRWAKMHSLCSTRFSRRAGTRALPAPKLIFALCYCWSLR